MKFKSYIPKPKLSLRSLLLLAITWLIAIPTLLANPLTTYADYSFSDYEVTSLANTLYNGTSSSSQGGNSAIPNGVQYTRTGYLCYLLTKDGSTTGHPAYAFASPGYNGIAGSKWVCTSRRGHSVSSWRGDAKWGVTPWAEGGSPSNEPKIKEWALKVEVNGKPNAQQFVFDIWGLEAEKNFLSDQYILVIETIMNFQYSIGDGSGGGDTGIVYISRSAIESMAAGRVAKVLQSIGSNIKSAEEYAELKKKLLNTLTRAVVKELEKKPNVKIGNSPSGGGSTGRTFTSDPLIGTVPNLIKYKNGAKVFDSYTNKVAPHAEKIKVSEAGFTSYPSSGPAQLTDAEVEAYGVAMLIIHCKNDAIHTYNGVDSPGPPEDRLPGKTGTCNIVKGYYKENLTTGSKESLGVYHELEVTSNIIVSGEPEFELVEYYCLTAI